MNNEILYDDVAVLIDSSIEGSDHYLQEFIALLKAAFYMPVKVYEQNLKSINKATYIGSGKIAEIYEDLQQNHHKNIKILVCNFDLTAVQQKNMEENLKVQVLDRSYIILKIFELNAKTKEAKLQVEIAKLNYMKSRLINEKASYSQVTSGSKKNKGEGEKQIELSRRHINNAISLIENRILQIKKARQTMREKRNNTGLYKIAIVGYTNAGKSTLMNRLLEYALRRDNKDVLEKDALFATLETSTRLIETFHYPTFLLADTVGFVSHLPIYLIKAFHSTLEELKEADLLIQVVDFSSPFHEQEINITNDVIKQLGCENIPMIFLMNKCDKLPKTPTRLPKSNELFVSLKDDGDLDQILSFISMTMSKDWTKQEILLPYNANFVQFQKDNYVVSSFKKENGYQLTAYLNPKTLYKYQKYLSE